MLEVTAIEEDSLLGRPVRPVRARIPERGSSRVGREAPDCSRRDLAGGGDGSGEGAEAVDQRESGARVSGGEGSGGGGRGKRAGEEGGDA